MPTTHLTRSAAVQIRGHTGPLWARIYWPPPSGATPALLIYFPGDNDGDEALLRRLCVDNGLIVLATSAQYELADATAVVDWAADHAAELEADPGRLLIAGAAAGGVLATEVSRIARREGWPVLTDDLVLEGIPDE